MRGDADLVLVNGRIFTAAPRDPWARGMAIAGDRIGVVGSDAQAERWSGRGTAVVDLGGRVVVPGFIDAHAHMADAAGEIGWVRLDRCRSLERAVSVLAIAAAAQAPGTWVVAADWDESKWPERRYPVRDDLDRASRDRRILAVRIDRHMASLNSAALEEVRGLVALRGFDVDGTGRPTGILKEDALNALWDRMGPSEAALDRGLGVVMGRAHRLGITSIHDVVDRRGWQAYQRAHRRGRLRVRVCAMLRDDLLPSAIAAGLMTGLGDEWLRLGAIKVFSDGSIGARTAALSEPYSDAPHERGLLVHSPGELRSILESAHRASWQTATHAIGDAAIDAVLDALESVDDAAPLTGSRHRIEHYELPTEAALERSRRLGIIASCQPNFIGQWSRPGGMYDVRLGARAGRNNPYRRILKARIPLCFGSDGMPYGPLNGIDAAVSAPHGDQALRVDDAIRAYTAGGAYASFEERLKGTLQPGRVADFVVLEGDPFAHPSGQRTKVQSTWIAGRRVFGVEPKS